MQDDAAEAEWFDVSKPPSRLAFDHKVIVRTAFEHLLKQHTGEGENSGASCFLQAPSVDDIGRTLFLQKTCI